MRTANPEGIIPDWHGRPILLPAEILVEIDHYQELGGSPNPLGVRRKDRRKSFYNIETSLEDKDPEVFEWTEWCDGDTFFAIATDDRTTRANRNAVAWQLLCVAQLADILLEHMKMLIVYHGKIVTEAVPVSVDMSLAIIRDLSLEAWDALVIDDLKASILVWKNLTPTELDPFGWPSDEDRAAELVFKQTKETYKRWRISVSTKGMSDSYIVSRFLWYWERGELRDPYAGPNDDPFETLGAVRRDGGADIGPRDLHIREMLELITR